MLGGRVATAGRTLGAGGAGRSPSALALTAALGCLPALAMVAAYHAGPLVPLVGMAACAGVALAIARPLAAAGVAIALVPLEVLVLELGTVPITPTEALLVLAAAGWIVRRLAEGRVPVPLDAPLAVPFLVVLGALVAGAIVARDPGAVAKTVVMWSAFYVLFGAVVIEGRPETVRRLLQVLAFTGAAAAVIATVQTGAGAEQQLLFSGREALGRAGYGSFAGGPNTLAMFLALTLPAAVALGLRGPAASRPAAVVAATAIFVGIALTLSRGGFLALAGALAVMLLWRPFRRVTALAAAVAIVVVLAGGASPIGSVQQVQTVTERLTSVSYALAADPRLELWRGALDVIGGHPLLGVGARNYVFLNYGSVGPTGLFDRASPHPHSLGLTIAAELGIPALLALLWAAIVLIRLLVRACRSYGEEHRALAYAVAAALAALAVHGLVDYALSTNAIAAVAMLLAGSAVVLARTGLDPGSEAALESPALSTAATRPPPSRSRP